MNKYISLIILTSLVFSSCSFLPSTYEREDFIRVHGMHFIHDGKPYYYAGTNIWYGCYLGSTGFTGDRSRLLRELDSLQAHHITNLRILGASEESYIRRSIKPAIQKSPGVVNDSLLIGLDFLLSEMAKRHMNAVIYLNNYWEWSGGMAQYIAWVTKSEGADPEDPSKGYGNFMEFSAKFYSMPDAIQLYNDYVKRIISRKNTINGRNYSDDPTIMAWELANEPRPAPRFDRDKHNLNDYYRWIDNTAEYIHSLDANHLVTTGNEGLAGSLQSPEIYLQSHKSRYIDYVTIHLWPLNWGWFNPKRISETLPSTEKKALNYINQHLGYARLLNKPVVMEEFGIGRDSGVISPGTPTTARDHYYNLVFRTLYDSARAGAPMAGSNFWTWGGEGRAQHPDGVWRAGDSFVGDPPQEPQGRNSIFMCDASTINIITDHALKMQKLGIVDSLLTISK